MRILSMIASLAESGGAEMLVRNLSTDYARHGHQAHITYISDASLLGASGDFERAAKQSLDRDGVTYGMIGHDARRNPLAGGWRLRRMVREFRPDIIHMHLGNGLLMQALSAVRTPTVYTHHNVVFKFPTGLFRLFDRFVDRYVGICGACETLLAQHVTKPITLIHNGVPSDYARGASRTALPRDVSVLSVGNLTPQKDYPGLVAAAALLVPRLAEQGRRIRFRIAGEGGERAAIERAIGFAGLTEHVELLGVRRDVAALMAEADLLVLASRFEGLPITLIEAAMSALPAVACDVGGCADIVADGESGRLVPPGDPAALAAAIADVLADQNRYCAYSVAAQRRSRQFTLATCADAHLKLYADVLAARRH